MALALFAGCTGIPEQVEPIRNFDAQRYLGTWYEIARLDHSFERGLSHVSAEYSPREGGGIRVLNRGYKASKGRWKDAEGKAYSVGDPQLGHLKVSFFGPFYASYVIFDLDPGYRTAFVSGNTHGYLWLLSRTPTIDDETRARFLTMAKARGFDTASLIWVDQDDPPAAE